MTPRYLVRPRVGWALLALWLLMCAFGLSMLLFVVYQFLRALAS